jgi:signal transduction histidine kinase
MISTMEEHTNEIRRAEAEVRRLNEELEARVASRTAELESANRELEDFAYIISHDLRAPLRAITRLAEWISEDYRDVIDDDGKRRIDLLQDRVRRMHLLIEGVLQYSRIGRIKGEETITDFNVLVREAVDLVVPPGRCSVTIEEGLPSIPCENVRMSQVFQNLVDNAVKYVDKPEGEIRIGCVEESTHWRFFVTDNGRGIDPKHQEKVFQIFQTLGPNDSTEASGIGLTLVKKIVEASGGRIWVESEPGKGSTFHFTLPRSDPGMNGCSSERNDR